MVSPYTFLPELPLSTLIENLKTTSYWKVVGNKEISLWKVFSKFVGKRMNPFQKHLLPVGQKECSPPVLATPVARPLCAVPCKGLASEGASFVMCLRSEGLAQCSHPSLGLLLMWI